jgi:hypothetical protein
VGDSKVIVDWFSFKNNLQVISLKPWMEKIRHVSSKFQVLKIQHIYREFNMATNFLSKQALDLEEEFFFFAKEEGSGEEPFEFLSIF